MGLYRVECPVTVVLVNHWKDQWVIPGSAGIKVPQYFLQYVQTLPVRSRLTEDPVHDQDRQSYYRVDVFLPSDLFSMVCDWLHTETDFNGGYWSDVPLRSQQYLKLLMKPWHLPCPIFFAPETIAAEQLNMIVDLWNTMEQLPRDRYVKDEMIAGRRLCFPELRRQLQRGQFLTIKRLNRIGDTADSTQFCVGCRSIYDYAKQILTIRQTILEYSDVWASPKPKTPAEIRSIAQMIALTKKISVEEALAKCLQQPFDPNALFWVNIESHIGQTSWQLLQKVHKDGRLDVKKPTFDGFLEQYPCELDKLAVRKLVTWAETVDALTKPLTDYDSL